MHIIPYGSERKRLLPLIDILLVFSAFFLALTFKAWVSEHLSGGIALPKIDWRVLLWLLLYPAVFYIFELYNDDRWRHNIRLLSLIIAAVLVVSCSTALFSYLFIPNIIIFRTMLLLHIVFAVPLIFIWRKIFERFF